MKKIVTLILMITFLVGCQSNTSSDQPSITAITIDYEGESRIPLHQPKQLVVHTENTDSSVMVEWSSSDASILSVSSSGLVTPIDIGNATVKASLKEHPQIFDEIDFETYCLVDEIAELHNVAPIYEPLSTYTPTRFKANTWQIEESVLVDGAKLNTVSLELNNGRAVQAKVLDIDLSKDVDIISGAYNDSTSATGKKQNLYSQVLAYEEHHPELKVIGATNADFFGNFPVNAFVKDNVIVKDAHNDNGGYDYTNTNNDIPASMPMLFGVHDTFAQIGPIVDDKTVQETIQSKLVYQAKAIRKDGEMLHTWENIQRNAFSTPDYLNVNLITSTSRDAKAPGNATVYTLKLHEEGYIEHGEVTNITKVSTLTTLPGMTGFFYVIVPENLAIEDLTIGDFIAYQIASEDDKWTNYQQVIGARQELVKNGRVVNTVTLENTNGAQSTNIPRTAVGIRENGHVALFAVESLYYGKNTAQAGDTYGVNLPELAEIMRYYGCVNAGNFDGGGSTQMIVSRDGIDEVVVRSSDYGTYNLNDGRAVVNSVLIVSPKKS